MDAFAVRMLHLRTRNGHGEVERRDARFERRILELRHKENPSPPPNWIPTPGEEGDAPLPTNARKRREYLAGLSDEALKARFERVNKKFGEEMEANPSQGTNQPSWDERRWLGAEVARREKGRVFTGTGGSQAWYDAKVQQFEMEMAELKQQVRRLEAALEVRHKENPSPPPKWVPTPGEDGGEAAQAVKDLPAILRADAKRRGLDEVPSEFKEVPPPEKVHEYIQRVNEHPFTVEARAGIMGPTTKETWTDEAGNYKPERERLHDTIAERLLNPKAATPEGDRPVALMLMGLPGAGKTTLRDDFMAETGREFTIVSADDVQEGFPEYKGTNANATHSEAMDVAYKKVFPAAVEGRHNLVLDWTGANRERTERFANVLKDDGYDVHVVFADVPPEVAVHRATNRFFETGRYIPVEHVYAMGPKPAATYEALREDPAIATLRRYDTSGPKEKKPPLVDSRLEVKHKENPDPPPKWVPTPGEDPYLTSPKVEKYVQMVPPKVGEVAAPDPAKVQGRIEGVVAKAREIDGRHPPYYVINHGWRRLDGEAPQVASPLVRHALGQQGGGWRGSPTSEGTDPMWAWAASEYDNTNVPDEVVERSVGRAEVRGELVRPETQVALKMHALETQAMTRAFDPSYDPKTDTIEVYRGISGPLGDELATLATTRPPDEVIEGEHRALESWTASPMQAANFAGGGGAVLRARVPVSNVVAAFHSSPGLLPEEAEYVIATPKGRMEYKVGDVMRGEGTFWRMEEEVSARWGARIRG